MQAQDREEGGQGGHQVEVQVPDLEFRGRLNSQIRVNPLFKVYKPGQGTMRIFECNPRSLRTQTSADKERKPTLPSLKEELEMMEC